MAAIGTDDAATVLDQFCHDVANLPAEIAHLLEEIQAKDQHIQDLRDVINSRDKSIQNFVRAQGGHVKNPKEEGLTKVIMANFDSIEILQAEKLGLSEKAMRLLDRNVRRFDVKLRDLVNSEQMPPDPTLPSLLLPEAGSVATSNTPSAAMAINSAQSGGAPNVANAAIARLHAVNQRTSSPLNAQNALLNQAHLNSPSARSQREGSADASKRRRLNPSMSGTVPTMSSSLRQSSLGPTSGTPKAGTPVPNSSRAGSAQPNKKAPHNKKIAPHQASAPGSNRKRIRSGHVTSKKDRKRHLTSPTPSSSRGSVSPTPSTLPVGIDGTVEPRSRLRGTRAASAASEEEGEDAEPDAEGEEDDTQVYCVCQRVSFGDMVACDNDDCPHQWFHWGCVDLKAEPKGEWLCPHCRELPRSKIVKTSDK
ncbi:hypothetical protein AUEXF2481DRAFT_28393 [Aureobasidium subglaciale EXF-2481]|uniref:Chromatin modification-related protein n=1 Tax=Aureobasidium subglaciale (strain EXF-2481) TaxID=1043005 RepID=A0A074YF45_AURSE|nr:uncharacterized protein AUEXF2481DRAFT_28393 [Aureobasidium subglaciale EXF-2481]KAI5203273.1 hypothetical protein E4T38_05251 [Aureobasidium subglaciale]KAI5220314.1 hypothetical protein E4T40_06015 [Aureobasidium subglaciale]KAI5222877.1 hypothetical protein E4T41_06441 [Aureobasidium subglaciale]KAI5260127.1 hypothetical protein E4T46_06323 [Aureobasidium subglaciale]KEQ96443.1 hypothetical protein AUEXF2481DRAFT_28393 [Aureobasidium subglaciale EXF-2481]